MTKDKKCVLILIGLVCVINGIFLGITRMQNVDEFTSIAVPALLSGKDWSDLTVNYSFHGYGFAILLTPVFALLKSGTALYMACLAGALILRVGCVVLAYHMLRKYLEVSEYPAFWISILCDVSVFKADDGSALSAMSEIPMAFVLMLLSVFLIKYWVSEKGKKRYGLLAALAFVLVYATTIHSRALIIWAAFFVTGIIYYIREKQSIKEILKQLVFFGCMLIVFFLAVKLLNNFIYSELYQASGGKEIANTTMAIAGTTGKQLKKLLDMNLLKMIIYIFAALLSSYGIYTFGTSWLLLALNVWYIVKNIKRNPEESYAKKVLLYLSMFGTLGWFGMNAAIAITSVKVVVYTENYRWLTYIRYAKPFLTIMALTGLVILVREIIPKKAMVITSMALMFLSCLFVWFHMAPLLDETGYGMGYTTFNRIFCNTMSAVSYFGVAGWVCLAIFAVILYCIFKEKYLIGTVLFMLASLVVFGAESVYFYTANDTNEKLTNATELLLGNNYNEIDGTIYYHGINGKYNQYLRMALANENIFYAQDGSDIDLADSVLLTDSVDVKDDAYQDSYVLQLDNNEYIITQSETLLKQCAKRYEESSIKRQESYDLKGNIYDEEGNEVPANNIMLNNSYVSSSGWQMMNGTYTFTFDFAGADFSDDDVVLGYVELWGRRELFEHVEITKDDIQKDGTIRIEILHSFEQMEPMYFIVAAQNDNKLVLNGVTYVRSSLEKDFGNLLEGTEDLASCLNGLSLSRRVYIVSENDEYCYLTDYAKVEKAFAGRKVSGLRYNEAKEGKTGLLLVHSQDALFWELMDKYVIIGENSSYMLLASNDLLPELEADGVSLLSGSNGIYLDYLQNEEGYVNLPLGEYVVTVEAEPTEEGIMVAMSNGANHMSDMKNAEELRAALESGLQYDFMSYGTADCYLKTSTGRLAIKRMSKSIEIPAEEFLVDDESSIEEDGIITGDGGGVKIFGPNRKWLDGKYIVTCEYEVLSDMGAVVEDKIGTIDAMYNGAVIGQVDVRKKMVEEDELTVEMPIVVQYTQADSRLEIRTALAEGVKLKLKSVTITQ